MSIEVEITAGLMSRITELQPYLDRYGLWALFVSCLTEGFGIPLPGETLLIACTLMAASGQMDLASVLIVAWLGTQLGDIIGYLLGRRGLKRLLKPGTGQSLRLARVETQFARWGVGLLVIGRFLDGIRQISNLAAGMLAMPWGRFLTGTLIGTSLWVGSFGLGAYLLEKDFHAITSFLAPLRPYSLLLAALLVLGLVVLVVTTRRRRAGKT